MRRTLTEVALMTFLALVAQVVLGPGALGVSATGAARLAIAAPTLLQIVGLGKRTPRTAAPAQVETPVAPGSPAPVAAAPPPVPPATPRAYTVRAGDTLWELSRRYGVAVDALAAANRGLDPGDLQVGQVLLIPTGGAPAPAVSEPAVANVGRAFAWPALGAISSLFGPRWGGFHTGIDLAIPSGTPVHAARDGTVATVGWVGGYGETVILDHSDGSKSLYAHNSRLLVSVGAHVNQGDTIAISGNTGHSTGPHLHFEVIVGNRPRNPLDYLPNIGLAIQEYR